MTILRRVLPFALWLGVGLPAQAQGLYLHQLTVDAPAGLPVDEAPVWRVALVRSEPAAFADRLPSVLAGELVDDRVTIGVTREQALGGDPKERHRWSSFVIDFDEPAVLDLLAKLRATHPEPTVEDLVRFTDRSIPDKHSGRGWDLASRVAARGEGDCSEHAVLLAALARAVGHPARVVIGIALIRQGDKVTAAGHAWAEVHDGKRWAVADSTVPPGSTATVRWVPLFELEDEGTGFGIGLMTHMANGWPERLELLPSAEPTIQP